MSSLLWKAYYEDDVDLFRQLLEASIANARQLGVRGGGGGGHNAINLSVGSPGGMSTSPTMLAKSRKSSAFGSLGLGNNGVTFTKADINWKDAHGMTILHHAASSCEETSFAFATALIEHPLIDLYVQDHENGWTALHRAFYFGNISAARMILERDVGDALGQTTGHVQQTIGLVKVKDREGHGPFDLYAATIKDRTLRPDTTDENRHDSDASDDEDGRMDADDDEENRRHQHVSYKQVNGDELYTFGSNRNVSLGFGDEDDRQYPERISLRRPEHLLRRFYREYLKQQDRTWSTHDNGYESQVRTAKTTPLEDIPWIIRTKPLIIQDVLMAKLHTAVLTTDPESNLYICGHGQGGRLGLGDEQTRYNFVCVETGALAGKKIATVALGQNHTLAISDKGEIFSWGNNGFGQLGFSLPKTSRNDEDPISTVPQQIFGPLKREVVSGVAASRIHSVAYTGASLFTFGKNEGQLGIVDSDARSLEMQVTPRKVAASLFTSSIASVSAIDKATVCLLENHDVWIFANFGYAKVTFPLEGFSNHFLKQSFLVTSYDTAPNRIVKVTSGGDTVCALSSRGEVFTLSVAQRAGNQASSTTNPTKIRGAVSQPLCIWSLKTGNMAARDVGVDADGSILLTTEEGSVWQRTKRAKIKNATASGTGEYKPKDYKFSRVSGLTRVLAVRASAHGAYAAVRRDCDVTKTQIVVEDPTLWKDYLPLFALRPLGTRLEQAEMAAENRPRFWQGSRKLDEMQMLRRAILESKDLEQDLADICDRALNDGSVKYGAVLTTKSSDLRIPVHRFLLTGRSRVLRNGLAKLNTEGDTFAIPDLAVCEVDSEGRTVISFQGYDILSLIDLAIYLYSDLIIEFWHIRNVPQMSHRYRQVRTELMKLSAKLELVRLEPAVRQMIAPLPCLDMDFEVALRDTVFFQDSDVIVQLEDGEVRAHSLPLCIRCPFFEGLFMGRAGGRWLAGRDEEADVTVDLTHITVDTFNLVLRHLYADTGTELFDNIASANQDEFLDLVLDVLGAANELMLDRLSQICQSVIGRYVNARNVCWLLNAISPSSVHEFKHASLEYLCLSLESMLQGHHLNELDEDLLVELDEVVRQNQLACMPFAKSGRAEEDLHERHPELAALLDRNRRVKIDSIRLRSKYQDMNTFAPGSLGDDGTQSPSQKPRRGSTLASKPEGERPSLKAKASSKDMMFAMDEEMGSQYRSPGPSPAIKPMSTPKLGPIPSESPMEDGWLDARGKTIASPSIRPQQSSIPGAMTPRTPKSPQLGGRTPSSTGVPWTATPLAGPSKTGLKDIMAQASSGRTSSLSQGIESQKAAAKKTGSSPFSLPAPKMSQKERKKMLQQQQAANAQSSTRLNEAQLNAGTARGSPWQTVSAQKVHSLKDVFNKEASPTPVQPAKPNQRAASTPHLTMRQTVANPKPTPSPQSKPVANPSTQHHQSPRSGLPVSKPPRSPPQQNNLEFPSIAQSIRHSPAPVEPSLQLSIADIVEQERLQKELLKEAVAKRDLGEIQAEQEFAEWWEKESRRVQGYEDESVEKAKADSAANGGAKKAPRRKTRGDGAGRGRGKARGGGAAAAAAAAANGQGRGQGRGQSSQAQVQRG